MHPRPITRPGSSTFHATASNPVKWHSIPTPSIITSYFEFHGSKGRREDGRATTRRLKGEPKNNRATTLRARHRPATNFSLSIVPSWHGYNLSCANIRTIEWWLVRNDDTRTNEGGEALAGRVFSIIDARPCSCTMNYFGSDLKSDRFRRVSVEKFHPPLPPPWISYYGFHGMRSNRLGDQVECSITCWAGSNLVGHNRESMF